MVQDMALSGNQKLQMILVISAGFVFEVNIDLFWALFF
jgi:hypothetical protein